MKKARFTETQIIALLKEAESGLSISELCRKHGISVSAKSPAHLTTCDRY